jgi:hypothetical protein
MVADGHYPQRQLIGRFDIHGGPPLLIAVGNDLSSPERDSRAGPEIGRNRGDRCWDGAPTADHIDYQQAAPGLVRPQRHRDQQVVYFVRRPR